MWLTYMQVGENCQVSWKDELGMDGFLLPKLQGPEQVHSADVRVFRWQVSSEEFTTFFVTNPSSFHTSGVSFFSEFSVWARTPSALFAVLLTLDFSFCIVECILPGRWGLTTQFNATVICLHFLLCLTQLVLSREESFWRYFSWVNVLELARFFNLSLIAACNSDRLC